MCWWKKFFSNWRNHGFKLYVCNYVLFFIIFVVISAQRKQPRSCNILIYAGKQWRICILWNYDISNCFETPNFHQNLDMIALKNCKELTQWSVALLWLTLTPKTILKYHTVITALIWLPWKKFKGLTHWALFTLWLALKPTILLKHQTATKTLIWLPWSE